MALSHNFSTQISNLEKLKEIAARCGFVQTRGPQKGEGSVRQMLEALIEGNAAVTLTPPKTCEQDDESRRDMEVQRALFAKGLIKEIKPIDKSKLSPFRPVFVEGEPVSKMIIRERR